MKPSSSSSIKGQRLSLFQRLRLALTGPDYAPFIDLYPSPAVSHRPSSNPPRRPVASLQKPERRTDVAQLSTPVGPQPVEILAPYLALSTKSRFAIRSVEEFVPAADDLGGQVIELIDHLFTRYPVPRFLYRVMLSEAGERLIFPDGPPTRRTKQWRTQEAPLRRWFYAVAQGDSFARLAKDTLGKREAHWFLQAPAHNDVATNLQWARVAALGFPPEACDLILRKFSYVLPGLSAERKMDLARFYARAWTEMPLDERDEIADFIRAQLHSPSFSLAGRTAASVRRLSQDWHRRFHQPVRQIVPHTPAYQEWKPAYQEWRLGLGATWVRGIELVNSRELNEEGGRQRHCVGSYASACSRGGTRIVSFRWYEGSDGAETELKRITVEVSVDRRKVVQSKGRSNRSVTPEEVAIIRLWATEHGLDGLPRA